VHRCRIQHAGIYTYKLLFRTFATDKWFGLNNDDPTIRSTCYC
jgi:hypothetical protein